MATIGIFRPLYYSPDLLWRWRAGWAGGAFSRASSAWYIGPDGRIYQAASHVPRIEWYDLDGDGVRETPTVLLEPASTNLVLSSADFGAAWGPGAGLVVTPATSVLSGQTAARHTNDGTGINRNRSQAVGTFSGAAETSSLIVENVDATETVLSLFDATLQAHVCAGRLTWATGQTSVQQGTGTVRAQKLADAGPNGGPVYRLLVTATGPAGNQRRIIIYPSGTSQNTRTVIVHHVQLEAGSIATSPIVTAASTVTRAADVLTFPWPHAPQAMAGYLRFVERGAVAMTGASRVLLQIGTGTTAPRLFVGAISAGTTYRVSFSTSTSSVASMLPIAPSIGDRVELLWRLYADGSVQIEQSINGGTPVVAARSSAIGLPSAWSGQILRLSGVPSGAVEAPAAWRDAAIFKGTDITWDEIRALVGT